MAKGLRVQFRPTPAGVAVFLLPLALLSKGVPQTGTAALIVGIGLPSLVLISLLFLLAGALSVIRTAGRAETCITALPVDCEIGCPVLLKTDPARSRFLPGIRLSVHWILSFGPFRQYAAAPLPAAGAGSAMLVFPRRGEWLGRSFIRACDPFGFFRLDCLCGTSRNVVVPPVLNPIDGADIPGRPTAKTATSPRLREDADERLERRAYIPGDDPRRLDWKLYARTGDMQVRVGEEGIPFRGRLWLQVVSSSASGFEEKKRIHQLDAALESAAALVRRLEDEGQDIRIILPGEEQWAGTEVGWDERLARSLPSGSDLRKSPASGERLWIIAHPEDDIGRIAATDALSRGCRVSLGYPAGTMSKRPFSRWLISEVSLMDSAMGRVEFRQYRRKLEQAESLSEAEGLDVRQI